jgi:hypothetical protein
MASQPKLDSAASAQMTAAKIAAQSVVEAHPELYHYTGTAGLKGIIESNSFRATYFADMNDAQEIHTLRVHLVDELKKRCVEAGCAAASRTRLGKCALSRCLCGRRRRADRFLLRGVLLLACGR